MSNETTCGSHENSLKQEVLDRLYALQEEFKSTHVTIPRAQHEANEALIAAAKEVVETSDEFRRGMGPEWEGDPLTDAVDKLKAALSAAGIDLEDKL